VQNCFRLEGHLTERDKVAPDFSCLLTLDSPRKDDIPEVTPLKWDVQAGEASVNDLHRLISSVLEDMTGNPAPDSSDLFEFIQITYNELFGKGA
jgi:phospholipase C